MYFVRKKDLRIIKGILINLVQFQMEDYFENQKIKLKQLEQIKNGK